MASKSSDGRKIRDQIHVARFQIVWPGRETHRRWLVLSREAMLATNWLWSNWEAYQIQSGMPAAIRENLHQNDRYRRGEINKRPGKLKPIDGQCAKHLYHGLSEVCPHLHATTREALRHRWQQNMAKLKASHGALPLWMAILLCQDRRPGTNRYQPVPIKKLLKGTQAFTLMPPATLNDDKAPWKARLRIDRYLDDGKATSNVDEVTLVTRPQKMQSHRVILQRITTGEWEFCSSAIQYDRRRNKWELLLYHRRPAYASEVSPENRAIVRPACQGPWRIRTAGGSHRIGGRGRHVEFIFRTVERQRRRVMLQRQSRKQNYRWSTAARKGHGCKRALRTLAPLAEKWNDTVKTTNQVTCRRIVDYCVKNRIGHLVYVQSIDESARRPYGTGVPRRARFLDVAGQDDRIYDRSAWAWYQLGDMLQRKCEQYGIVLEVRKRRAAVDRTARSQVNADVTARTTGACR